MLSCRSRTAEVGLQGVGAGVERARGRAKDQPHSRYVPSLPRSESRLRLTCLSPGSPLSCTLLYFCRSHVRRLLRLWLRHPQIDCVAVGGRGLICGGNITRHRLLSPARTGRRALPALRRRRSCARTIVATSSYTNLLYIPAASTNLNCRTRACMRGDRVFVVIIFSVPQQSGFACLVLSAPANSVPKMGEGKDPERRKRTDVIRRGVVFGQGRITSPCPLCCFYLNLAPSRPSPSRRPSHSSSLPSSRPCPPLALPAQSAPCCPQAREGR